MGSSPRTIPAVRTVDELIDAADLRAAISAALNATPIDDEALRRAVWTFVGVEGSAGTKPGDVILVLTELMTEAQIASVADRRDAARRVILWCVEAYFGHLGGTLGGAPPAATASEPRPASRR